MVSILFTVPGDPTVRPIALYSYLVTSSIVDVDASASYDQPPGSIVSYDWDWGDGTAHGSGVTAQHIFLVDEITMQRVVLTITDDEYNTARCVHYFLTYPNQPPVPLFDLTVDGWSAVVDASASYDVEGDIALYEWDWGDGSELSYGVLAEHLYSGPDTYDVTLTVYDEEGLYDSLVKQAVIAAYVSPSPPSLTPDLVALWAMADPLESGLPDTSGTEPTYPAYDATERNETTPPYDEFGGMVRRIAPYGGYIVTSAARDHYHVDHSIGEDLCAQTLSGAITYGMLVRRSSLTRGSFACVLGGNQVTTNSGYGLMAGKWDGAAWYSNEKQSRYAVTYNAQQWGEPLQSPNNNPYYDYGFVNDEWVPVIYRVPANGQQCKLTFHDDMWTAGFYTRSGWNFTDMTRGLGILSEAIYPCASETHYGNWHTIWMAYLIAYKGYVPDGEIDDLMDHLIAVREAKGLSKPIPRLSWYHEPGSPLTVNFDAAAPQLYRGRSVAQINWSFGDGVVEESTADTKTQLLIRCEGTPTQQNITDDKGHTVNVDGNTQFVAGGPSWLGSSCIIFDGTGDRLVVPYFSGLDLRGDWTLEFWEYHTAYVNNPWWYSGDGTDNNYMQLYYKPANETTTLVLVVGGVTLINHAALVPYNTIRSLWNHIVLVKKDLVFTMYVNGQRLPDANGAISTAPRSLATELPAWSYPFYFGFGRLGAADTYYTGYLDSIRFSREALYDPEKGGLIVQHFQRPHVSPPATNPDAVTQHTYDEAGTYVVECRMEDDAGESYTERHTLYIGTGTVPPVPRLKKRSYSGLTPHTSRYEETDSMDCVAAYLLMENDPSKLVDYSGHSNDALLHTVTGGGITFNACPTTGYSVISSNRDNFRVPYDTDNTLFWMSKADSALNIRGHESVTVAGIIKRYNAGGINGRYYMCGWGSDWATPTNGLFITTDGENSDTRRGIRERFYSTSWTDFYGTTYTIDGLNLGTFDIFVYRTAPYGSQASGRFHYPIGLDAVLNQAPRTWGRLPPWTADFRILGDGNASGYYCNSMFEFAALMVYRGYPSEADVGLLAKYLYEIKTIKGL